jgi:hypothetical protein
MKTGFFTTNFTNIHESFALIYSWQLVRFVVTPQFVLFRFKRMTASARSGVRLVNHLANLSGSGKSSMFSGSCFTSSGSIHSGAWPMMLMPKITGMPLLLGSLPSCARRCQSSGVKLCSRPGSCSSLQYFGLLWKSVSARIFCRKQSTTLCKREGAER